MTSPDLRGRTLAPELVWTGSTFERQLAIEIDHAGTIVSVRRGSETDSPLLVLPGRAILPGFVNAHSHAFQRGLRAEP
ncbi:MAG: formimidoylglutamate deiminase, partial [Phycisphaerae bacterium]|nr:formimidoylglutamate deiminase [Phycisphaerae bacterium]MDW8263295.1 hypothetical protein [Phycisphaerales bacterium]